MRYAILFLLSTGFAGAALAQTPVQPVPGSFPASPATQAQPWTAQPGMNLTQTPPTAATPPTATAPEEIGYDPKTKRDPSGKVVGSNNTTGTTSEFQKMRRDTNLRSDRATFGTPASTSAPTTPQKSVQPTVIAPANTPVVVQQPSH